MQEKLKTETTPKEVPDKSKILKDYKIPKIAGHILKENKENVKIKIDPMPKSVTQYVLKVKKDKTQQRLMYFAPVKEDTNVSNYKYIPLGSSSEKPVPSPDSPTTLKNFPPSQENLPLSPKIIPPSLENLPPSPENLPTFKTPPQPVDGLTLKVNGKFECAICGKYFSDRSNCNKHVKTKHMKVLYFPCDICNVKLSSKQALQNHAKNKHLD